jgi:hypothetical protein
VNKDQLGDNGLCFMGAFFVGFKVPGERRVDQTIAGGAGFNK